MGSKNGNMIHRLNKAEIQLFEVQLRGLALYYVLNFFQLITFVGTDILKCQPIKHKVTRQLRTHPQRIELAGKPSHNISFKLSLSVVILTNLAHNNHNIIIT